MRIVSLLPAATEIVAALGLAGDLVGRSHECDFPPEVEAAAALTRSLIDHDISDGAAIDVAVAELGGDALYALDDRGLADLAPDVVITQGLCPVCAVDVGRVHEAVERLEYPCRVIEVTALTLPDVLSAIVAVGAATGVEDRAREVVAGLEGRLDRVRRAVAGREGPDVVCLEWLEPPYAAGHWVPDQVALAGGRECFGRSGRPSVRVTPEAVAAHDPEWIALIPCGFSIAQTLSVLDVERFVHAYGTTRAVRSGRVVALDATSHFSRPGPRLVDGVEALAGMLHPDADLPSTQAPAYIPVGAGAGR